MSQLDSYNIIIIIMTAKLASPDVQLLIAIIVVFGYKEHVTGDSVNDIIIIIHIN